MTPRRRFRKRADWLVDNAGDVYTVDAEVATAAGGVVAKEGV